MRFQRELLTKEICEELQPLLEKHYREIAHYQDIALEPGFEQYIAMENAGALRFFSCRTTHVQESELSHLAGYAIFFVKPNLHYQSSIQASQDILFIDPRYREYGFGKSFISFCDEELRKESVQVVYHHVKQAHNFGPLLESLGYQLVDLIYGRRLD